MVENFTILSIISETFGLALGPIQSTSQWVLGVLSSG